MKIFRLSLKNVFWSLGFFFLVSCSTTKIKNLGDFKEKSLPVADVLPSKKELKGKKPKVVIFPFVNLDETSKKANSGEVVYNKISQVIGVTNAEIIDRQISKKFTDEIRLAQQNEIEYTGPEVADYAIDGKVVQTNFYVVYNPPSQYKENNEVVEFAASCTYHGSISGQYQLYRLPENKVLRTFPFRDSRSETVAATERNVDMAGLATTLFTGRVPAECRPNKGLTNRLINRAAEESIRKSRIDIQNFFSPRGYIINMLEYDGIYLVKVNIGTENGLLEKQTTRIFSIKKTKNLLTDEETYEERQIAEGLVTDQISSNYAYILLEPKDAEKLHLGDFVKIRFSKSGFEKFADFDWL